MRRFGQIGFPCVWVPKRVPRALPVRISEVLYHPEGADMPAAHDRRRQSNYEAAGFEFATGGGKWTFDVGQWSMVNGRLVWIRDCTLLKMYALPIAFTNRDGEKGELYNSRT